MNMRKQKPILGIKLNIKINKLKTNNQSILSGDLRREQETEITSPSHNFLNTSVEIETIKTEMT